MKLILKKKLRKKLYSWKNPKYNDTRGNPMVTKEPPPEVIKWRVVYQSGCVQNGRKRCADMLMKAKTRTELTNFLKEEWKNGGMTTRADERNKGNKYKFCGYSTFGSKLTVKWFEIGAGYKEYTLSWEVLTGWYVKFKDYLIGEMYAET